MLKITKESYSNKRPIPYLSASAYEELLRQLKMTMRGTGENLFWQQTRLEEAFVSFHRQQFLTLVDEIIFVIDFSWLNVNLSLGIQQAA